MNIEIQETRVNIISEGTSIQGEVEFDHSIRVHGTLLGNVKAREGSVLILGESAVVEGNIHADTLFVNGYVKGDIEALSKVQISGTGRVIGNIRAPIINIEFGAFFEGRCEMEENHGMKSKSTASRSEPSRPQPTSPPSS